MSQTQQGTPHPRLHLLATGVGFAGLIIWFAVGRQLGILDWITALFPPSHAGAGLMVAIMLMMTPGFLIWKFYNRWVEKRLQVKGRYYEDDVYLPAKDKQRK